MIYVDESQMVKNALWCHMWSDASDEELDTFALKIGLKKEWAQESEGVLSGRFYHYDLRVGKRLEAIKQGAQYMRLKHWIELKSGKAFCSNCNQIKPFVASDDIGGGVIMRWCAACSESPKALFMRRTHGFFE